MDFAAVSGAGGLLFCFPLADSESGSELCTVFVCRYHGLAVLGEYHFTGEQFHDRLPAADASAGCGKIYLPGEHLCGQFCQVQRGICAAVDFAAGFGRHDKSYDVLSAAAVDMSVYVHLRLRDGLCGGDAVFSGSYHGDRFYASLADVFERSIF